METISVKVSRTQQVKQYEPVTVEVVHTVELQADEDVEERRLEIYKGVTQAVKKYIDNEVRKYRQKEE